MSNRATKEGKSDRVGTWQHGSRRSVSKHVLYSSCSGPSTACLDVGGGRGSARSVGGAWRDDDANSPAAVAAAAAAGNAVPGSLSKSRGGRSGVRTSFIDDDDDATGKQIAQQL